MNFNSLPVNKFIDILASDDMAAKVYKEFFIKLSEYFPIAKADIVINSDEKKYRDEYSYSNCNAGDAGISKKYSHLSGKNFVSDITLTFSESYSMNEQDEFCLEYLIKLLSIYSAGRKYRELIENAGIYDSKTGFLTAEGFHRKLAEKLARNITDNHSVIFMNIKDFKLLNEKYGHQQGAKTIVRAGKNIDNFLDRHSFFAYLGGDNFVVYINNDKLDSFLKYISRFPVEMVNAKGEKEEYFIVFNAGVCDMFYPEGSNEPNPSYVIENAQIAMNIAKNDASVGNIVHFRRKIKDKIMYEKSIEASMQSALKNGEFVVRYQPKVSLDDYKLRGSEALVRWNKNGETLPPDSFIPVFEKNGFICRLDFYVLETVCQNMKSWIEKGIKPVKVSVNFSKTHVENPELVERIISIIKKYNVPAEYIEIEFTETSCVDNPQKIKNIISGLKEFGITTSMDDFGTGYSSFNMLKEMLVDNLKLDKSFLGSDSSMEEREEIIIKNVIKMAKELDIEVISEGVETEEQVNLLHSLKCDIAQGFYFDKPLSADEYEARLVNINYNT
ncbi:MAG: putative bifunctional diguanylate cyclase/phosphodiesterase [Oscillospiraceae bacterium]